MLIAAWNDRQIEVARSRGGVLATARVRDNLMYAPEQIWPDPAIVQKLYASHHAYAFDPPERQILESGLGYYCDLQSLHSEDAITWSFFGTLAEPEHKRKTLNWLCQRLDLPSDNEQCALSLWRRIPHPDRPTSTGGPELDVLLVGDRTVIVCEAKWRSAEGQRQGVSGTKGQIQLRLEYLDTYGPRVFGDRLSAVVGLARGSGDLTSGGYDTGSTHWGVITWTELAEPGFHPQQGQFARYLEWKTRHSL